MRRRSAYGSTAVTFSPRKRTVPWSGGKSPRSRRSNVVLPAPLSLRIKSGQQAFSNTPVESRSDGNDGFTTVTFAPTRPLPSYLTAFAVGPWERLDAGKAGRSATAVGVIVPRGLAAE